MTKEELEDKFEDCFDDCTQSSEGGYGADTTNQYRLWKSFQPAILEYAKQQAIAFNNWFMKLDVDDLGYYIVEDKTLVVQYLTREQAYDKFIEQQNKP